ncbi:MAG: hypothetical protein IPK57_10615, partial [Chitinophagaceae bacterium]|nr:hypothetical protein [Chitinophagaceae bacterium]
EQVFRKVLDKIFLPSFITKPTGEKFGLGLSLCVMYRKGTWWRNKSGDEDRGEGTEDLLFNYLSLIINEISSAA